MKDIGSFHIFNESQNLIFFFLEKKLKNIIFYQAT